MNDGLWALNENGFITFANEKICQMMGCARDAIIGHDVAEFIDHRELQRFQERFMDLRRGIYTPFELICRSRDGRKIFTIFSPVSFLDDQKNFTGGFVVVTDITERKQAEIALKGSEERFRTIFDCAFDGILLAEPEEKQLVTGNRAICKMLGYSLKELQSMTVYDIHPREHLAEALDQFERMERGDVTVAYDIPLKNKDGRILYVDISCSHLSIRGRRYLMGIFRDITERRQSEEQRNQWNERLESLVMERTKQLEAVVAELESEIIERRQAENFQRQRRHLAQETYDEIVQSLTELQTSLKNMIYIPAEDIMYKVGDMHSLVEEILGKVRKSNVTPFS